MSHEFSLILMIALTAVAILTGHVALGWLALARRNPSPTLGWKEQLTLAGVLGTGACATAILGLTNEVVEHAIGYGAVAAPVLWLGAVILCLPLSAALAHSSSGWAVALATVLLTAVAAAAQMGWVWAAGFRPGVQWDYKVLGAACTLMVAGFACAIWVAGTIKSSSRTSGSARRDPQYVLKFGSAAVLGLSLMVGQQIMLGGADLDMQRGSVYRNQVPGTLMALACGALLPLTLAVMSLELSMRNKRRQERRRSGRSSSGISSNSFAPQQRSRRRHGERRQ